MKSKAMKIPAYAVMMLLGLSVAARASPPSDIQDVRGACDASSHMAEGPWPSDLTKRESRFLCDDAVITFWTPGRHVMVTFNAMKSRHAPQLAFAGEMDRDGIMMDVDNVYLQPGVPTRFDDANCKFFFKNRHMTGIFCGGRVDENGRRTVAVVVFNAAPGQ